MVIEKVIGLYSVLRPHQHSIGYMGDGFYRSKDPTNSIKILKEMLQRTRKPCCRRETARCRCKLWSIPSPLALCWSNISQSNAVSQYGCTVYA